MLVAVSHLSWQLASSSCIPSTPPDFLKYYIPVNAALLPTAATAFQSPDYQSSGLCGRNSGEARHGACQVSHDVTDRQRSIVDQYPGEVVFGQQSRRDGSCRVQIGQTIQTTATTETVWRLILRVGMIDGILEINVGIHVGRCWRRWRCLGRTAFEDLGWKGRGDGIGRGEKPDVVLLVARKRLGSDGGEAFPALPEASIARFRDVNGRGHAGQGQRNARVVVVVVDESSHSWMDWSMDVSFSSFEMTSQLDGD